MAYDNTNKGAIWKNENRKTDKHPHYTGSINVDGVEYWLSAWRPDEGGSGKMPALKFAVNKKEPRGDQAMGSPSSQAAPGSFDDDIPF